MEQRYQAVLAVQADGHTVTEVAEKFGVSRQSVHTWLRRYEEAGPRRARGSVASTGVVPASNAGGGGFEGV